MRLRIVNSTSHWVMPRIIIAILIILWIVILFQRFIKCKAEGTPFINLKGYHFFVPGWDKVKLLGAVLTYVVYIYLMQFLTFLPASIISIFAFNVIFAGEKTKKSIITSAVIAVGFSLLIYVIFGVLFGITLP